MKWLALGFGVTVAIIAAILWYAWEWIAAIGGGKGGN